jgi:hypothetical protein
MSEKPLPCPFCGCEINLKDEHKEGCWLGDLIQGEWGTRCSGIEKSEIKQWNKREAK